MALSVLELKAVAMIKINVTIEFPSLLIPMYALCILVFQKFSRSCKTYMRHSSTASSIIDIACAADLPFVPMLRRQEDKANAVSNSLS